VPAQTAERACGVILSGRIWNSNSSLRIFPILTGVPAIRELQRNPRLRVGLTNRDLEMGHKNTDVKYSRRRPVTSNSIHVSEEILRKRSRECQENFGDFFMFG
jgi:hypothetical protein